MYVGRDRLLVPFSCLLRSLFLDLPLLTELELLDCFDDSKPIERLIANEKRNCPTKEFEEKLSAVLETVY